MGKHTPLELLRIETTHKNHIKTKEKTATRQTSFNALTRSSFPSKSFYKSPYRYFFIISHPSRVAK